MPNSMNITPPVVSTTPGPEWAQELNDILTSTIAEHNHQSPNGGVTLTQDALNITDELSLNGNPLTNANSVGLASETSSSVSGTNRLYNEAGDLYYRDGNGSGVRITENGGLAAASFGGISGLSGTQGSATFSGLSTFVWKKTSTAYASMNNGPVKIYSGNDLAPTNGIVLVSKDGLAADTTLTLPNQLPAGASQSFMVLSGSGEITASVPLANGITNAMFRVENFVSSSEQDAFSVSAISPAAYADVPNLSCSITTTGRPVQFIVGSPLDSLGTHQVLVEGGSLSAAGQIIVNISGTAASGIDIERMAYQYPIYVVSPSFSVHSHPLVGTFSLPADTYTIKVKARKANVGTTDFSLFNFMLSAHELI